MAIAIQLNAIFNVGNTIYTANMKIPASGPTSADPFLFEVTSVINDQPETSTPILTVAVGAADEIYVAVAPPGGLINSVAPGFINALSIVAEEGDFHPTTGHFGSTSIASPAA